MLLVMQGMSACSQARKKHDAIIQGPPVPIKASTGVNQLK